MRSVLSISIPPKKLAALKKRAKSQGLTVSAYFLRFVEEEEHLISEEELLEDIRQSEKDFKAGRYTVIGPNDRIEDFLPVK
ncbi:MAG: hypothetical protein WCG83_02360 [Candidatus Peregrinibacteria bacterium]